jgi:hypothetical protein
MLASVAFEIKTNNQDVLVEFYLNAEVFRRKVVNILKGLGFIWFLALTKLLD